MLPRFTFAGLFAQCNLVMALAFTAQTVEEYLCHLVPGYRRSHFHHTVTRGQTLFKWHLKKAQITLTFMSVLYRGQIHIVFTNLPLSPKTLAHLYHLGLHNKIHILMGFEHFLFTLK
jgi:hypothetical protein